MKKHPFLMALLALGAIFLFFVLVVVAAGFVGRGRSLPIGEKIGVIELTGVILASKTTIENIIAFRNNPSIKGIVLRVDSPGGGVGPSQEIHEEIKKTVSVKPVVVSMGSVAASGGYYVSAPVNRIFANPGTITGSIGVIMEFTNIQELLGKIGLENQVIKSGEHKDIGSPIRPMTDSDRQILQSLIDDTQQQFVAAVAEGRKMTVADVVPLADGRVFTGRQALAVGLVDELGNLQDAILSVAKMAGIEGEPRVVYPPREKPGVFQYLIQESATQLRRGLQEQSATGLQFIWPGIK
jgi:protease-4